MSSLINGLKWIANNTGIDEMLLEAGRAFLATSIAVALGLGIPLLDISGGDFRMVLSAGLAACLQVIVPALNPEDAKFGVGKAKAVKAEEKEARESTEHIQGSAIDTDGDGIADEYAGSLANEVYPNEEDKA